MKSDWSKDNPLNFSHEKPGLFEKDRPVSPAPSDVSMKSDWSKDNPLNFSKEPGLLEKDRPVSPAPSDVSMQSDWSKDNPLNFSKGDPGRLQKQRPESSSSTKKSVQSEDDPLQFTTHSEKDAKHQLKAHLQKKFLKDYKDEQSQRESHTELYKIKSVTNKDDKGTLVKSYNEIFKSSWMNTVKSVLMKGVAGVGKTCQTRMLMIDWAKEKSNKDIDLIVPFHLSELNSRRGETLSMEDLLNHFFNDIKLQSVPTYDKYKVVFVLDGLEECQLHLDFENNKELTDIKERASMDVLLTNLIKGNLLPSARLWIISQPSGVDKIPPEYIQRVTECREKDAKPKLRAHLQKRILEDYKDEQSQRESHSELYKIKGVKNKDDKGTVVKSYNEIFESSWKQKKTTVLMKGVAGVGKTSQTRMLMIDWGKGKSNKDIDLIVPFHFSELNSRRGETLSMKDLLNHFFNDIKLQRVPTYDKYKVVFVLDGLEECQLDLDFENNKELTDIKERASMDVLLTNLIKGNLLPSARLWIISRPSGVVKIPPEYIQTVTECRGKKQGHFHSFYYTM
ncbi:uncharacterized protein [Trachinotus anak]|uniref:uncharacterized protein n=1 Tax=Trachinotus anak TaxID=443729 RepID=UPI0039F180EF